jgi:putative nucleotidyltransferase with HDIG domain
VSGYLSQQHPWSTTSRIRLARIARLAALAALVLALLITVGAPGDELLRLPAVQAPLTFIVVAALGLTAWAAYARYGAEHEPGVLVLCLALAAATALYVPTAIVAGGDAYLLFSPLARSLLALGLMGAVSPPAIDRLRALDARKAVYACVGAAVVVDVALLVLGPDSISARPFDLAAVAVAAGAVGVGAWSWVRDRGPLDMVIAGAAGALVLGGLLFVGALPWQVGYWAGHFGVLGAAAVLNAGMLEERVRRGRLSSAIDAGGMSDMAEHIVDSMSDGLAVFDDGGTLVGWNPAAEALTGWSHADAEQLVPASTPDGLVPLGSGKWVRAQSFTLHRFGKSYRAILFTDARDELEALQARETLEQRVAERTEELEKTQSEVLERLAQAAELRDDDTGEHTRRVGDTAAAIANELGLDRDHVELIRRAAPLHDVGKIGVPDELLLKPGRLSDEELAKMREHTTLGAQILSSPGFPLMRAAEEIAISHHERWDGGGYPNGLAQQDIPLAGRIVAVADVFDALTNSRPYKQAWTVEDAVAEIARGSGSQFDRAVVEAFLRLVARGVIGAPPPRSPRFVRAASDDGGDGAAVDAPCGAGDGAGAR